jgi:hypothetical protein
MKVKFKNGIKLTAESRRDSEFLYMFLSGGKHSFDWFQKRIGKEVVMIDKDQQESPVSILNEKHAYNLYSKWQDSHYKFTDLPV